MLGSQSFKIMSGSHFNLPFVNNVIQFCEPTEQAISAPEKGVPLPDHGTLLSSVLKMLDAASERYLATSPTPLLITRDLRAADLQQDVPEFRYTGISGRLLLP